MGHTGTHYS